MDPSYSILVNVIAELQQEKRDYKIAFEKKVAELERELRIEQHRNAALMQQLIEALGNGPTRNEEMMQQWLEALEIRRSRVWAEREISEKAPLTSHAVVEAVAKAVNTLTESAIQVQRAIPEAEMRLSRKHSVMRIEIEKALASSTTELMSVMKMSAASTHHVAKYEEVDTFQLVDTINHKLADENDDKSLISKVVAKMEAQAATKIEANEKVKKGTHRMTFLVSIFPRLHW